MIYDSEYYRQREVDKIRKYMKYGFAQYREDWETSLAVAMLMSDEKHDHLQPVLDSCFERIEAFEANNPGEVPWEE